MAERRMMTRKVTDDDHFMALSASAQALYLHLMMSADDDGFNNQVTIAMFRAHASVQDLHALLTARYIYQFDDGVIVIRHWRMANALRKDRYTPTAFQKELKLLKIDERGVYQQAVSDGLPLGCQVVADLAPQDSIGKDSIGKDNKSVVTPTAHFTRPTVEDVREFCDLNGISIDAQAFIDYYTANDWKVGRVPMKSWQATVRNWARRDKERKAAKTAPSAQRKTTFHNFENREDAGGSWDELEPFKVEGDINEEDLWEQFGVGRKIPTEP